MQITHHTLVNLFGDKTQPIKFYLLPGFRPFDSILGNDTLRELSAVIHTADNYFAIKNGMKIPIYQYVSQDVNNLEIKVDHLSEHQATTMRE